MITCLFGRTRRFVTGGAASISALMGCGGIAEVPTDQAPPPVDQPAPPNPENPHPDGTGGSPAGTPPPPTGSSCECPDDGELIVLVYDQDGVQTRYDQPPLPGLAPGSKICTGLERPSAYRKSCQGSGSFALGACNDDGACVELGFKDELMVLNLWTNDLENVKAVVSRNWKFETRVQEGTVSGTFLLADEAGGAFQGAFAVCDLLGSSAQFDQQCE